MDPFNCHCSKVFPVFTHLVAEAITPHGTKENGDFSMLRYIPMEFSQMRYRELVEPFLFVLGVVTNMTIKDEILVFVL